MPWPVLELYSLAEDWSAQWTLETTLQLVWTTEILMRRYGGLSPPTDLVNDDSPPVHSPAAAKQIESCSDFFLEGRVGETAKVFIK